MLLRARPAVESRGLAWEAWLDARFGVLYLTTLEPELFFYGQFTRVIHSGVGSIDGRSGNQILGHHSPAAHAGWLPCPCSALSASTQLWLRVLFFGS